MRPLLAVLLAAAPLAAGAQSVVAAAAVQGRVRDRAGDPLAGVEVAVASGRSVVTDSSGRYELRGVAPGAAVLRARMLGYEPIERAITLEEGEVEVVDFVLLAAAAVLPAVEVDAGAAGGRMADFWRRKAGGIGLFVTREDIDRRKATRSSDLVRSLPGVRVGAADGVEGPTIAMGRNALNSRLAGDCRVNYYVDGMWMPVGTFHLDDIAPDMLEGLEIYRGPAEIPARFRQRETACGLILVWTRIGVLRDRDP